MFQQDIQYYTRGGLSNLQECILFIVPWELGCASHIYTELLPMVLFSLTD